MKRKISIIFFATTLLFIFFPIGSSFAAEIPDDKYDLTKSLIYGEVFINKNGTQLPYITDGDPTTYSPLSSLNDRNTATVVLTTDPITFDTLVVKNRLTRTYIRFYRGDELILSRELSKGSHLTETKITRLQDIDKIEIYNGDVDSTWIYEIALFDSVMQDIEAPGNVTDLKYTVSKEGVTLSYTFPNNDDFSHVNIYKNGILIAENHTQNSYTINEIENGDVLKVVSVDFAGNQSEGKSIVYVLDYDPGILYGKKSRSGDTQITDLDNLTSVIISKGSSLYFDLDGVFNINQVIAYSSSSNVYLYFYDKNNNVIGRSDSSNKFIPFKQDASIIDVDYKNVAYVRVYNSTDKNHDVYTLELYGQEVAPLGDVKNFNVKSEYNKNTLTWDLPKNENFSHVNIYREKLSQTSFFDRLLGVSKAYATYEKIGETTENFYIDENVESEKDYKYTVTTVDIFGEESEGVSKTIKTPKAPPITFEDFKVPFGVSELIKSGNSLFALVGSFVLLGLSLVFVPRLIKILKNALRNRNNKMNDPKSREKEIKTEREIKTSRETKEKNDVTIPKEIKTERQRKSDRTLKIKERAKLSRKPRELKPSGVSKERRISDRMPRIGRISNRTVRTSNRAVRMPRELRKGRG